MKKTWMIVLLVLALVLCGCGKKAEAVKPLTEDGPLVLGGNSEESAVQGGEAAGEETEVPATVPADGNPKDVTCKGSYTGQTDNAVVATVGDAKLTNAELQVWYWAQVAQYRQEEHEEAPDFDRALDTQVCQIDDSVASWQQYFLREALNAWHTSVALVDQSEEIPMPTEEAYQPNLKNHETYLTDIPATEWLYAYGDNLYKVNTLHQEYLDALPETLDDLAEDKGYSGGADMAEKAFGTGEKELEAFAQTYNQGYMYFTAMSYYIEPTEEDLAAFYTENASEYKETGKYADIRHILLVPDDLIQEEDKRYWRPANEVTEPIVLEVVEVAADGTVSCSEEAWAVCEQRAQTLLTEWQKDRRVSEFTFAEIANKNSDDTGTMLDGGRYLRIREGQLLEELDSWIFDESRVAGDTTIVRSKYGVHMLYFSGSEDIAAVEAEEDYYRAQQQAILEEARKAHPVKVEYSKIILGEAEGTVAAGEILYPDVAHERYPEVPLYLQQDYPRTMYGGYKITSHGCGITTLAMLASYMADEELTPPEMCAAYGRYSHSNGTDGMIFNYEPAVLGFYLREKTYDIEVARQALHEGQIVISIQHKGYWTRGGHYLVLERIEEDDRVQVRDSNIYNYGKLAAHKEDLHKWGHIIANGAGYWVYEDKITYIPACSRCGTDEAITESLVLEDYTCHKCAKALLRRNSYLNENT